MMQHQDRIDKAEKGKAMKGKSQSHCYKGYSLLMMYSVANSRQAGTSGGPTVVKPWENVGRLCK